MCSLSLTLSRVLDLFLLCPMPLSLLLPLLLLFPASFASDDELEEEALSALLSWFCVVDGELIAVAAAVFLFASFVVS
jgi:hypothetical protein